MIVTILSIDELALLSLKTRMQMIAIIGGGISGLSLAYFLQKTGQEYMLFEKSEHVGGFIKSEKVDDYMLEYGPNSLLCGSEVSNLLIELGLKNDTIEANDVSKSRFIVRDGKPKKMPSNPVSMIFGSFFSWKTKKKIFKERKFKPQDIHPDETLSDLIERHFGSEVVEYLLKPFIAGIYAGDPDHLVARYSFPKLKAFEKEYGSILKGFIKGKGGARRRTVSFKGGMIQLPNTILSKLKNVQLKTSLESIEKNEGKYLLKFSSGESYSFGKVVFATSPYDLVTACESLYETDLRTSLLKLKTPSVAAVHTVYNKIDVGFKLEGFGALNPKIENCYTAGTIWSSSVFDHKAPTDKVLLSTFVGGMQYQGNDVVSEEEIKQKVTKELAGFYNIKGKPVFQKVTKWKKSIPQYGIEMKEVRLHIEKMEKDNIFVCSNWKDGISIEDCINNAKALALTFNEN